MAQSSGSEIEPRTTSSLVWPSSSVMLQSLLANEAKVTQRWQGKKGKEDTRYKVLQ